ncbi:hypothetical protein PhiCrAssBcn23_102 [Bacteroides phage PhiCrAssBcn23]|uniref:Uncharacterized protein n=1 Tax=Kehishuvirus sp. 'tikkala' TaxID=3028513 RepID=A0AAF0D534_9CAUD|nr:hypothetical protein PhiCrAssBcn22_34 [Bacteroides phage PhiCrAssBcn22]WCS67379.1 hypothetical protein PhiCrAssBcn23_102 [Bacteroides phage PhiCrAssBcn23]WEU69786.1 hypothetical protein [Kehishuvirus sp. 'tikkala']
MQQIFGFISMTGQIILGLILLLGFIGVGFLIKHQNKVDKERIWVHKKTGGQYKPLYVCQMKDITSRQWFESIAYISLKTGEIFIRERKDFLKQFITLKEWEKEK